MSIGGNCNDLGLRLHGYGPHHKTVTIGVSIFEDECLNR